MTDDTDSTRRVDLAELLRRHVRAELAGGVRVSVPARVVAVRTDDAGNVLEIDAEPAVHDYHRDEAGELVVSPVPVVAHVPVAHVGAGGYRLTVPCAVGDLGLLVFADRSLDAWLSGDGRPVDPELYARWNLADAVFLPGLRPFGGPWRSVPADHATLGADGPDDGTNAKIHFRRAAVVLGDESGAKPLGLDGDPVDCGTLSATTVVAGGATTVTLAYLPPGGTTPQTLVTFGAVAGMPGSTSVPVSGLLRASAQQAKAR